MINTKVVLEQIHTSFIHHTEQEYHESVLSKRNRSDTWNFIRQFYAIYAEESKEGEKNKVDIEERNIIQEKEKKQKKGENRLFFK